MRTLSLAYKPTQDILDVYLRRRGRWYACLDKKIWLKKLLWRKILWVVLYLWADVSSKTANTTKIDRPKISLLHLYNFHVTCKDDMFQSATTHEQDVSRMLMSRYVGICLNMLGKELLDACYHGTNTPQNVPSYLRAETRDDADLSADPLRAFPRHRPYPCIARPLSGGTAQERFTRRLPSLEACCSPMQLEQQGLDATGQWSRSAAVTTWSVLAMHVVGPVTWNARRRIWRIDSSHLALRPSSRNERFLECSVPWSTLSKSSSKHMLTYANIPLINILEHILSWSWPMKHSSLQVTWKYKDAIWYFRLSILVVCWSAGRHQPKNERDS